MTTQEYANHGPVEVTHPGLVGKVAVVTGAARGMGAVFAEGLVRQGVSVLAVDLDEQGVKETAARIEATTRTDGPRVLSGRIDVVAPEDHEAVADRAVQELGSLDIWVNNAGVFPEGFAPNVPAAQLRSALAVNVEGVLHGAQAAARRMQPGASIVNMASVAAVRVRRGRAAYCASKAAVQHLTESLAVELGDLGIRVNAIAPGFIDTAMTRWVHEQPGKLESVLESVPLHRIGSPEEVLAPLLFLVSDSARYVTGHTLAVDGGSRFV